MTITKRTSTSHTPRSATRRSPNVALGPGAPKAGMSAVSMAMATQNSTVSTMPGTTPASSSLPMDCSVMIP